MKRHSPQNFGTELQWMENCESNPTIALEIIP
jgi:hypothetical protein